MSKQTTNENNIAVFLDNIGRTIIGKVAEETEQVLQIVNPALVHIQANPQTNQLQLQLLPLFFREFQLNKEEPTTWNYRKQNITTSETIELTPQFKAQYEQLFQVAAAPQPQEQKVVKLFDEEAK